jgi:CheY-like chemotaxis protein
MPRILVADDQADVLAALRLLLKGEGFDIETVSSPAAVLKAIDSRDLDVALLISTTRATPLPAAKPRPDHAD